MYQTQGNSLISGNFSESKPKTGVMKEYYRKKISTICLDFAYIVFYSIANPGHYLLSLQGLIQEYLPVAWLDFSWLI